MSHQLATLLIADQVAEFRRVVFDASRLLLYPVLAALLLCVIWVLIEIGVMIYETVQRLRHRDLDTLEMSALRARKAFAAGKPRAAYRHLRENSQSIVVTRFLFDLVRNYQSERLAAKPLKLLQEYEFYTVRRLERTRLLTRVGPVLGLMGALIPLGPALTGLARGDVVTLARNLETAFALAVLGLLVGGLAFAVGLVRERFSSQDISDLEYLLEILEGNATRLDSGRRRDKAGTWEGDPEVIFTVVPEDDGAAVAEEAAADESVAEGEPDAAAGAESAGEAMVAPTVVIPMIADAAGGAAEDEEIVAADDAPDTTVVQPAEQQIFSAPVIPPPPPGASTRPTESRSTVSQPADAIELDPGANTSFDDPERSWYTDDDPFASLGPVDDQNEPPDRRRPS